MHIFEIARSAVAKGSASRRRAAAGPLVAIAQCWPMQPVCTRAKRLSGAMDEALIALANAARDLDPQARPCHATLNTRCAGSWHMLLKIPDVRVVCICHVNDAMFKD
jgi:hypothetical protein